MVDCLIPLTPKMLEELRIKQYKEQGGKCAILGIPIRMNMAVLDHRHKLKAEECGGEEGLGCCRGILHHNVNVFEGKLWKNWRRYGLKDFIDLPTLLRRLADYIESPPMEQIYIHPNSKPKRPRLLKPDYSRICKYYFDMYPKRKVLPKYPKDGIMTEKWRKLLVKANNFHISLSGQAPPGYFKHVERIRSNP